jgi:lipopolysaccharide/colanic/teichoic acid biosynthesis glycosyltransferase
MEHYSTKRALDVLGALVGILIFSPLIILVTICIKLESDGPAILKLPRCGKDFEVFMQYKLRSMRDGADKEATQDPEIFRRLVNNNYKIKDDPRVTRIGNFIRLFSIDELPQFFNVLKGNMSLVGPRPPEMWTWNNYLSRHPEDEDAVNRIVSVTPGITGLWQVSGRSELTYKDRVKLDIEYIETMSLMTDIKILLKTIFVVVNPKGAW